MLNSDFKKDIDFKGTISLEDNEYIRLSDFIVSQYGIKLPPNKKSLLQGRLQKRLRTLQFSNFKDYVDYLFSLQGLQDEVPNMIDAVSTNKTDFFRELNHFDFLTNQGLRAYIETSRKNKLSIWSAGCSSGEEPYSIAMTLKEFSITRLNFDFDILATDISESVIQHAIVGIYNEDKVLMLPESIRHKYLLKGKNEYKNKVRITSELRNKITFKKFNLISNEYSSLRKFDIIFCRNVMIYFERDVQYRILRQFCRILNPGGFLFIGHSESITGFSLPLTQIKPTIFFKSE
jgi:chemotaxis protein methyltransferase CheR